MAKIDLDSPELYLNRELSWLEFNHRVLGEGLSADVPLMERVKFLAIVSSNLDEFFMIRVAGLKQRWASRVTSRDPSGLTAGEAFERIAVRVHRMVEEHSAGVTAALSGLEKHGLRILDAAQLSNDQREYLDAYFASEVQPVLTPMAVAELNPFPALPGLGLHLAFVLAPQAPEEGEKPAEKPASNGGPHVPLPRIAVVPVPGNLPRFVTLPAEEGLQLVRLEHLIRWNIRKLFPQTPVEASAEFRLTRDADVRIDEDDASDLLSAVEQAVRERRRRAVVRLEVSAGADPRLTGWLVNWLELSSADVYPPAAMLDATALMDLASRTGFDQLRNENQPPVTPRDLAGVDTKTPALWTALQERDVMLFHPYESFQPVVDFIEQAAADPGVIAIKQTLYRTSGDSPIVRALAQAAERGKQVTALVELTARFDEAKNIAWARRLEDAGCHVIYGVAGYKTHAKMLLVIRREAHGIRRYVHMSTGNYNERTARLYSDVGIMTSNADFGADASAFFNLLTGYSQEVGWQKLTIAPTGLRRRFVKLIDREIGASTVDQPGLIMAKVNSLEDPRMVKALYRASQAGVKVMLNVRGISALRPGVEGVSENIRVVSIVDRYLEHARMFYFRNGGREEVYLASADWMERNLDRRLETLFPVIEPALKKRVVSALETYFQDNVKAWQLQPDGTWERVKRPGPPVRAQEKLYRLASESAEADRTTGAEFKPLTSPRSGGAA